MGGSDQQVGADLTVEQWQISHRHTNTRLGRREGEGGEEEERRKWVMGRRRRRTRGDEM